MSDFHITEKETYFPVEFYGDFNDTGKKGFPALLKSCLHGNYAQGP